MKKMHDLLLVIYPENVQLDDVMYPYQEIDKTMQGKINDERCQFFLTVEEKEIPSILNKIKEHAEKEKELYLEMLQYRSEHTLQETKEKYGGWYSNVYDLYITYCNELMEYEKIKDLPVDDPQQIEFIKQTGYWATHKYMDIYLPGKGYGTFCNPYELFDYYQFVPERVPGAAVLVNKNGGRTNQMRFNELDIDETVISINEVTTRWEYLIFCPGVPHDSKLYTVEDCKFGGKYLEHDSCCLVDNLRSKLIEISNAPDKNYVVTALDFHW